MPNIYGEGAPSASGMRVAIVAALFNDQFTKRLCNGAVTTAREHGVADEAIDVYWVPGAFEIPLMAGELAASGAYDAIACVGAVVRGETPHFDFVAGEAARGIMEAGRDSGVPVGFGVITRHPGAGGGALRRQRGQQGERGDVRCSPRGRAAARGHGDR
ncbi:MAG: 6,7-dimethyl-8-ribityllumazine synthase [Dehalococcoidia bacterium]